MSKILSNWLQKQYKKERSKDPRIQGVKGPRERKNTVGEFWGKEAAIHYMNNKCGNKS
jgi:hypothetical protein